MTKESILELQKNLIEMHRYMKLQPDHSREVRAKYVLGLVHIDGLYPHATISSTCGTIIAHGYSRVVVGDYGAFIEIPHQNMVMENIQCKPGQEYRVSNPKFRNVKYAWLTTKDDSDCKIYKQKNRVSYADYKPGMYYVCPYDVVLTRMKDTNGFC